MNLNYRMVCMLFLNAFFLVSGAERACILINKHIRNHLSNDKKTQLKRICETSPITQRIAFENAINHGSCNEVLDLMATYSHLRTKCTIGCALWSVWKLNASYFDLDKREFRIVSPANVFFIAKELAIKAKNKDFLESYILVLQTDEEIRRIVFPHYCDTDYFDSFLLCYADSICQRGIKMNVKNLLCRDR